MILVHLFTAFSKIGLLAIGGAYSFLPLIEKEVVEKYQWLSKEEFLDALGLVKVFPGAISIKFATFTGYKVAGIAGAIVANLGNFIGPIALIICASSLYYKYKDLPSVKGAFDTIQLVMFAMIIAVAFRLMDVGQLIQVRGLIIITATFGVFMFTKIHPALIILTAGLIGAILR